VIIVVAVNLFVIGLVVMIHYEFLYRITLLMPQLKIRHRFRIVFGVFVALTAHAAEVWVFAISFLLMHRAEGWSPCRGWYLSPGLRPSCTWK
jgi:hypothetical protein